jgi:hypothetical protein
MNLKKKVLLFLAGFILLNSLFTIAFYRLSGFKNNKRYQVEHAFYDYSDTIEYLFMGYSRVNRAINTDLIPGSFKYYGGGETTWNIYYRLKYILKHHEKEIGMVILPAEMNFAGFNPAQMYVNAIYWRKYVDFVEFAQHSDDPDMYLSVGIKIRLFPYFQFPLAALMAYDNKRKERVTKKVKMDIPFSSYSDEEKEIMVNDIVSRHLMKGNKEMASDIGVYYLKKIIALSEDYQLPIVFLKYPLTDYYYNKINEMATGQKYTEPYVDSIITSGTYTRMLDYVHVYGNKLDFYYDPQHLNATGRDSFSLMIRDTLQNLTRNIDSGNMIK